ncbi:MAG: hypothetical protein EAZ66_07160, partial [Alphaproteobacteria bacterium]
SVKQRTMEYLQNSYDIHNIFTTLFEPYDEEKKDLYLDSKGEPYNEDWTIPQISILIRGSGEFKDLPKIRQKEYNAEYVKTFFRKNALYKKEWYMDAKKHAECLKGWRLKIDE